MKIIAHIPAREKSERLKLKNLQLLKGKPLVYYAIEAALQSQKIDEIYLNTESDQILSACQNYPIKFFKRASDLAQADITQDRFNYDFISRMECDYFLLINPVCPLINSEDIKEVIELIIREDADTVITCTRHEAHAIYENKPVNFFSEDHLQRTQDLEPVKTLNWAINCWRRDRFVEHYQKYGFAVFVGKVLYHEIPQARAVKINYKEDLALAECLLDNSI